MTENIASQLKKYFAGEANAEEKKNVLLWLATVKDEKVVKEMMEADWEDVLKNKRTMICDSPKIWNAIEQHLHSQGSSPILRNVLTKEKPKQFVYPILLKVAAMLIVSIGLAYIIFFQGNKPLPLTTNVITKEAPANASNRFKLPDGSTIYLNKGSKVSYNKDFATRDVTLDGEGFFEVTKNPLSPFQVHVSSLTVKVLGTIFNVSSYASNPNIAVYLSEGSVAIQEKGKEHIIKPGQLAIYSKQTSYLRIEQTESDSNIAWTERKLIFKNDPLTVVLQKLEKRYLISTQIIGAVDKNCLFNAVIENDSLTTVLELIKISSNSTYTVKGDSVIVYPGRCK